MKTGASRYVVVLINVVFAAALAAGILLETEWLWGIGAGMLAASLIVLAAFTQRERRLKRISRGTPLARWEYSPGEAERIAPELVGRSARMRRRVTVLLTACAVFIAAIFAIVLWRGDPKQPAEPLALLAIPVPLPVIVAALHAAWMKARILRDPCVTVIGRDHLVLTNTIPVVNEREKLQACGASYIDMENGFARLKIQYTSITRTKTTVIRHKDLMDIPVPETEREAAKRLAALLNSRLGESE